MAAFYQKFLRKHLDLSSLSVMRREDNDPYFCTPKGASIFGWAGVDGIHFCFVRGFGETVFAISPMNGGKDCVHVIARDFNDFLRLLLGHTPEQAGNMLLSEVTRRIHHRSVTIDARMEDLVELVAGQNFVPVTDGRGMLCGIVTRRDVICQLSERCKALEILKDEQ